MAQSEFQRIADFEEGGPLSILGIHDSGDGCSQIRCFLPLAERAWLESVGGNKLIDLEKNAFPGFFTAPMKATPPQGYVVCFVDASGYTHRRHDPYAFQPELTDYDIYLFRKGELLSSYETLGAHVREREGVRGVRFAVWAPNAKAVSVIGNFNHWSAGSHPMTNVRGSGIWEIFIPETGEDELYKFAIKSALDGKVRTKTDPYAFRTEMRPRTGSVVADLAYRWSDGEWLSRRKSGNIRSAPLSIYEVHFSSWKRKQDGTFFSYREIGPELIAYVRSLGFTHIELLPVMEHPLDASWGYQVVNHYSPTSRNGSPADFMWFVNECHRNGIGVILDWVPAHFPDDEHGLSMFDGTHLFDHEDPRRGRHPDWGTSIFNYGRNEVRNFLISSALFWIDRYHADGIRIDAVSSMLYLDYSRKRGEWLPNRYGGRENIEAIDFIRALNSAVHEKFPGVFTVAEESTAWQGVTEPAASGGLGFDFKWNMGWMHDTLEYFGRDPVHRRYHQNNLSFSVWYAFSEKFILPFSHDEVVHGKSSMIGKMPGDYWQKFANLRLCLAYMFGSPGKKLLFMGGEFGQWNEWNENTGIDFALLDYDMHRKVSLFLHDLNELYVRSAQLHSLDSEPSGFEWIDFSDTDNSVISFMRHSDDGEKSLLFVFNMTPVPRFNYLVGVPWAGRYREVLNSDSTHYGGSGLGNFGEVASREAPWHGRAQSLSLTLPPLAAVVFEHV